MKPAAAPRNLDRLAEQETILRFDSSGPVLHVFTCHPRVASALLRRGAKPLRVDYRGRKTPASWAFTVPRNWFRTPAPPRKATEAQRQASRQSARRLALARGDASATLSATGTPSGRGVTP